MHSVLSFSTHPPFSLFLIKNIITPVLGEDVSPASLRTMDSMGRDANSYKSTKLVAHFLKRENYIMHHSTAVVYARLGVRFTKVKRVLKYIQSDFLKVWIDLCTEMRIKCSRENDSFGKNLFKLFINATFGKFIEDMLKRVSSKLFSSTTEILRELASPYYSSARLINAQTVQIMSTPSRVVLNRPVSIGYVAI